MNLTANIVLNSYSILLLVIICIMSLHQEEKEALQNKVYRLMIESTVVLLIVDVMGRFDGKPDTVYFLINHVGNYLLFILTLSLPSFWFLYVYIQIMGEKANTKRVIRWLLGINIFYIIIISFSIPYGLFYSISSENIYQRGPLNPLIYMGLFAMTIAAYFIIIKNRKEMEKKQYFALAFFAIPPTIGIILQIAIYGIAFMLNLTVLSLLVLYLNIQNQSLHIDYLTGISNRKKLDTYLRKKISTCNEKQTFAAMMLDLNNFKKINDEFGHDVGDNALRTATRILCSCLRFSDFIARFGGDEFFIILDVSNKEDLECVLERMYQSFSQYNETKEAPFELSVSIGYAFYDYNSNMKLEDFQKLLDILMYEDKQVNKNQKK